MFVERMPPQSLVIWIAELGDIASLKLDNTCSHCVSAAVHSHTDGIERQKSIVVGLYKNGARNGGFWLEANV